MTYQEAKDKKNGLAVKAYQEQDFNYFILVTPANMKELKLYADNGRQYNLTDEDALQYCTDGNFKLRVVGTNGLVTAIRELPDSINL